MTAHEVRQSVDAAVKEKSDLWGQSPAFEAFYDMMARNIAERTMLRGKFEPSTWSKAAQLNLRMAIWP